MLESLQYLNHPLREEHARRFVRPALDLLREIQQTGDIFFPDALDGLDAVGAPIAGGGEDRARVPGESTRSIRSG